MFFFGLEDIFKQFTATEVANFFAMRDSHFEIGMAGFLDTQVTLKHFLGVLADVQLAQVLDVRQAFKEQDALDQLVRVLHLVDGFVVLVLAELVQAPIFIHARMQEVLIDRDQLIGKDLVEMLDDCNVAFHDGVLPCISCQ
ncbi:hypothetical protein D9M71_410360 [compost metagenome]